MADRAELLEAALDVYPEGLALVDHAGRVVCWNRAAEILTGHSGASVVGRELPQALEPLICRGVIERGTLVHVRHQRGHDVPAIARRMILRDPLGARIGSAAVFHSADQASALPHGETCDSSEVRESQAGLRDRLQAEFDSFAGQGVPLGVLWITVDQAGDLRKSHGARACETMLENVERLLANALRPGDEIGRWGDNGFLVLSHEPEGEVLANHARALAGIARTADFQWWGDRIALTVSIGAAESEPGKDLSELLRRAQKALRAALLSGGDHVTLAAGGTACSRSWES